MTDFLWETRSLSFPLSRVRARVLEFFLGWSLDLLLVFIIMESLSAN